ncbi:MAG: hypothetical protein L3J52_08910 [Proteobacteria bacterium]|nr:hypothetical protein [Pseudomonadota bacterium]
MLKILLVLISLPLSAQIKLDRFLPESSDEYQFEYKQPEASKFKTFEEAAQWADLVAIAQVYNTDYQKTRSLNSSGQAFLIIRVAYKGASKNEIIIVNAKGFDDHLCYYPERENEGRRFLVFLKATNNDSEYAGFKPFCQLEILLTDLGQYALRYPMDSEIDVADEIIEKMEFNDPHSVIDATEWTGIKRDAHQQKFQTILTEDSDMFQKYFYLTYSKGISISHIRKLMNIPVKQRIHARQM